MYNPNTEEVFEIRGNVKDPAGTGLRGQAADINLTKAALAHPRFRWHDRIVEGDLYQAPDKSYMYHFYCPQCTNALQVTSHKKDIRWRGEDDISISTFSCAWDNCGLKIEVHNGKARDV